MTPQISLPDLMECRTSELVSDVDAEYPVGVTHASADVAGVHIHVVVENLAQEIRAEADVVPMEHTADAAEHIDTPIIGILRSKP